MCLDDAELDVRAQHQTPRLLLLRHQPPQNRVPLMQPGMQHVVTRAQRPLL
jgi:hypothetical protein